MDSLRSQLALLLGGGAPLPGPVEAAFADECAETNRRRLRVLFPLMALGHAVHVWVFGVTGSARAALPPAVVRWRDGVAATHAVTLAVLLVLTVWLFRGLREKAPRFFGAAATALYVLHGAVISSVDQLSITSVTPFIGYCLGTAVVMCLTRAAACWIYGTGLVTFVAGILALQPSPSARLATLPNGATIVCVSIAVSLLAYAARRREFVQRRTIDEQRAALAALNAELEQRVDAQVSEIVQRAQEVDRLNAQLQLQVRERSEELSRALEQLGRRQAVGKLQRGTTFDGRFEVERLLGEGGMGAVYSGVDHFSGSRVAIKVIRTSFSQTVDALQRFLREVRTAATVTHPAVVRMLHVDVTNDGVLYQVQELVDGEALEHRLRMGRRFEPAAVARFASVLCEALAAAHARGVVHRDVKPGNVMLTKSSPGLKLLDFGISKLVSDVEGQTQEQKNATRTGVIVGTPAFMGPEQIAGEEITDRADIYAVGVLMFLLLAGAFPFEEELPLGAIGRTARDVRRGATAVPGSLAELVARCLRTAPQERPPAAELARSLSAIADQGGAPALDALERLGHLHDLDAIAARQVRTAVVERTA